MQLRRKVRPAGAAARRAALRWWLLSLAATGAAVTAAAALLAVALHFSGSLAASASSSSGAPYRLSQPREAEELRWEREVAPPQLASPQSRKVIDWSLFGARVSPCSVTGCRRRCFFESMGGSP
jgi:hypothetical protein